ncbi:MAG: pilus assembly protein PilP [Desulfobacterales bacterium]|jgi:type IV pilus assembly protein PilP
MIEKNMDQAEISTQLLNALRDGYAGDHEKALSECPFSEQAIAYAFEELTPDVQQTMEAHFESCRACMDLILDARTAQIESQKLAQNPPKILPALSDVVSQPAQPSLIKKIVGGTFMTLRIIAAPVAVICFMIVISRLNVLDGVNFTGKKMQATDRSQTIQNKVSPVPALETKRADQPEAAVRKDPATVSSFSMHENWSTDPFEPAFGNKPRAVYKKSKPSSPLEALDPSQLRLVGVMLSDKGNKALVEDASGKGYMINEGTHIGLNAGKVSQILKDRLIIEEKIEDAYGKIRTQKRILKLYKP